MVQPVTAQQRADLTRLAAGVDLGEHLPFERNRPARHVRRR
jgi:hypothetical protein